MDLLSVPPYSARNLFSFSFLPPLGRYVSRSLSLLSAPAAARALILLGLTTLTVACAHSLTACTPSLWPPRRASPASTPGRVPPAKILAPDNPFCLPLRFSPLPLAAAILFSHSLFVALVAFPQLLSHAPHTTPRALSRPPGTVAAAIMINLPHVGVRGGSAARSAHRGSRDSARLVSGRCSGRRSASAAPVRTFPARRCSI